MMASIRVAAVNFPESPPVLLSSSLAAATAAAEEEAAAEDTEVAAGGLAEALAIAASRSILSLSCIKYNCFARSV